MISGHIAKGKKLLEQPVPNAVELESAKADYRKWRDYAKEMLNQTFNNTSMSRSLNHAGFITMGTRNLRSRIEDYMDDFSRDITTLESIEERLPLIPESEGARITSQDVVKDKVTSNKVFVVHGRDVAAKSEVARFLERLGLEPVILHEQANEGRTIIEKFEAHSNKTGYAVVILSPDDVGSLAGDQEKVSPRARQNVVFEWGYFIGKLGRDRVSALHFENVERPSDYDGVLYIPFDTQGAWQILIARELKQAGYKIDLNLLA